MSQEKAAASSSAATPSTRDAFTESRQIALVCVDAAQQRSQVTTGLQELGFTVHTAETGADAAERMRKTAYQVVVVDEEFQGGPAHENLVLDGIRSMVMPIRRYIFVALLGKQFKTFDHMAAFSRSVNAVVSINDLSQIKGIVQQGLAGNDEFYRVFREVLREAGRR